MSDVPFLTGQQRNIRTIRKSDRHPDGTLWGLQLPRQPRYRLRTTRPPAGFHLCGREPPGAGTSRLQNQEPAHLLVVLVLLSGMAAADYDLDDVSKMKCADVIIEIGDQQFAFQLRCGPSTAIEENGLVWIYDHRPADFIYYVTFTEGPVERIQVSGNNSPAWPHIKQ